MKAVSTDQAPAAIGPYSQAVRTGNLLFCSGQIPIDPSSGVVVGTDVAAQTEQVMKNLAAVLAHVDADFSKVLSSTIYLTDLASFEKVNAIYEKWLKGVKPARATIQVAGLPRGSLVEISMIASVA